MEIGNCIKKRLSLPALLLVTVWGRGSFLQPPASPNSASLEPCGTWYGPCHALAPADIQAQPISIERHSETSSCDPAGLLFLF